MASFTWEGNLEAAHLWYPFAIDKQRQLDHIVATRPSQVTKNHPNKPNRCLAKHFTPAQDVLIMVSVNPHHIHIKAEGYIPIYMETGWLDHGSFAPANALSYKPSYRNYNDFLNATHSVAMDLKQDKFDKAIPVNTNKITLEYVRNPLLGKIEVSSKVGNKDPQDEGWSDAVGCPSVEDQVTSIILEHFDGSKEKVFSDSPPFCDTDLIRLKECQTKVPSSLFTGKLQAYIQALYGSTRANYNTLKTGEYLGLDWPLFIDGEMIPWHMGNQFNPALGQESAGILTSDDWEYWYVVCARSSVSVTPMEPTAAGKAARRFLRKRYKDADGIPKFWDIENNAHHAAMQRLECYILSTLEIQWDAKIFLEIEGVEGLELSGYPLGYGWHFNWLGRKANIILHEDWSFNEDNDPNKPKDTWWHSYHYQATFYWTPDDPVPKVRYDLLSENKRWSSIENWVAAVPVYWSYMSMPPQYMSRFANPIDPDAVAPDPGWPSPSQHTWKADIYCYYNRRDEIVVASMGNEFQANEAFDTISSPRCGLQEVGAFVTDLISAGTTKGNVLSTIALTRYNSDSYSGGTGGALGSVEYEETTKTKLNGVMARYWYTYNHTYWVARYYDGNTFPSVLGSDNTIVVEGDNGRDRTCVGNAEGSNIPIDDYINAKFPSWEIYNGPFNVNLYARHAVQYSLGSLFEVPSVDETKLLDHVVFIPFGDASRAFLGERYWAYRNASSVSTQKYAYIAKGRAYDHLIKNVDGKVEILDSHEYDMNARYDTYNATIKDYYNPPSGIPYPLNEAGTPGWADGWVKFADQDGEIIDDPIYSQLTHDKYFQYFIALPSGNYFPFNSRSLHDYYRLTGFWFGTKTNDWGNGNCVGWI